MVVVPVVVGIVHEYEGKFWLKVRTVVEITNAVSSPNLILYFLNNSVKTQPILIIFDIRHPEET